MTGSPAIRGSRRSVWQTFMKYKWFYLMMLPGVLYFLVFKYGAMWGLVIAFQNFNAAKGVFNSPWVGLTHFKRFFASPEGWVLIRNTFALAIYNIVFYFPIPIIVALMLNEIRNQLFKRVVQSLIYIPHFISWMVVVGISYVMLNNQSGVITLLYQSYTGGELNVLLNPAAFRPMIVIQSIWKEAGWGTIVFLAALAGVDIQLYEAAYIDGATPSQRLWHITLPSIRGTIMIMLILRLGRFLDTGFDQIFNMLNAMNREVGQVFDTYIYQTGIVGGQMSYTTAVGFFKSLVGLVLVFGSDRLAKRLGEEGVY